MQADIPAKVALWLEDLADPVTATECISALGTSAIVPLIEYLRRPPGIVPQSRARAVELLGRFTCSDATIGLREVLHVPELERMSPTLRQAEAVVKNGAVEQLIRRDYPQRDEDMAFAVTVQRVPAAVSAVAMLGLVELAPAVAALLTDDALADVAVEALVRLDGHGRMALEREMDTLLGDALQSARARLAIVRAALGLYGMGATLEATLRLKLAVQPHPALRAAAALFDPAAPQRAAALVDGALSEFPALAQACRDVVPTIGATMLAPIRAALAAGHYVDLYGDRQRLSRAARRALALRALDLASADSGQLAWLLDVLDSESLAAALPAWVQSGPDRLGMLLHYPRAAVRASALGALSQCRWDAALRALLQAWIDADPEVRRAARRLALRHIGGNMTR